MRSVAETLPADCAAEKVFKRMTVRKISTHLRTSLPGRLFAGILVFISQPRPLALIDAKISCRLAVLYARLKRPTLIPQNLNPRGLMTIESESRQALKGPGDEDRNHLLSDLRWQRSRGHGTRC